MLTKEEILQTLEMHKDQIKSFGVERIGLFGSHVRDEQREDSDVDILVELIKDRKTLRNYIAFCEYIEQLFNSKKVDIVTENGLSQFIGPYILKEVKYAKI